MANGGPVCQFSLDAVNCCCPYSFLLSQALILRILQDLRGHQKHANGGFRGEYFRRFERASVAQQFKNHLLAVIDEFLAGRRNPIVKKRMSLIVEGCSALRDFMRRDLFQKANELRLGGRPIVNH